jgi:hypothetical protein
MNRASGFQLRRKVGSQCKSYTRGIPGTGCAGFGIGVHAIHNLQDVLKELEAAPDDFGGNKAAAIRDTHQAIHSVRKALYFRLHMDDAAIDRVQ